MKFDSEQKPDFEIDRDLPENTTDSEIDQDLTNLGEVIPEKKSPTSGEIIEKGPSNLDKPENGIGKDYVPLGGDTLQ